MLPARLFAVPAARLAAAIAAGVLGVGLLAGAIRVLPLLLAPGVPLGLAPALARGALGMALETALVVAPPLAWALAAARLVDRGDARALFALGVRPARLIAASWPALIGVAAAAGLSAAAWGREAAAPGRLVREVLADARAACLAKPPPVAVDVPLAGLSWVCTTEGPPRAVGPAPMGGRKIAAFAASSIAVSDDLRSLDAEDLTLVLPSTTDAEGGARLHASRASVRGLAPIGRASNLSAPQRALAIAVMTAALAAGAAAVVLLGAIANRSAALAIGASGPAAALLVFASLERAPAPAIAYVAVPAAGLAAIGAARIAARLLARGRRGSAARRA